MKSPFPGMDPYIESHVNMWGDFHTELILTSKAAIASRLPDTYAARCQYRAYVVLSEADEKKQHDCHPDVEVTAPTTETEPLSLRAFIAKEYRETFLEIYEVEPEWRLVTCIEVLSPSNKRPNTTGWEQYLRKRQALLLGEANLIEIDLLRGGTKMPMLDPWPNSPYTLLVARREKAPSCKVWPAHFHLPLPTIPIPLSPPHADISLDLQPIVEAIYARSRYFLSIDYTKPLSPPLTETESAWLAERLRQRATAAAPTS